MPHATHVAIVRTFYSIRSSYILVSSFVQLPSSDDLSIRSSGQRSMTQNKGFFSVSIYKVFFFIRLIFCGSFICIVGGHFGASVSYIFSLGHSALCQRFMSRGLFAQFGSFLALQWSLYLVLVVFVWCVQIIKIRINGH